VRPGPLHTSSYVWPIALSPDDDDDDSRAVGGVRIDSANGDNGKRPAPVLLDPP
jgi:hypothetical protein